MTDTEILAKEKAPAAPDNHNMNLILAESQEVIEGKKKQFYWIDASLLNSIELCGQMTYFNHILNLRLPNPDEIMENGSFLHDLFQLHYLLRKAGQHKYPDIIKHVTDYGIEHRRDYGISPEQADFVVTNYGEYADFYSLDGWQPIEIEATFSKVLYEDDFIVIVAIGVIDLITDSKAGPIVVDHKSYWRWREPIKLNNQLMMYSWATEIPHVVFNKVGFQKSYSKQPEKKFRRKQFIFTPNNIVVWERQAIYWAKQGIEYHRTGFWPRNYTSCDKFRGCRFIGLCESNEDVIEFKMKAQFVVGKAWDPHKKEEHKDELRRVAMKPDEEDGGLDSE
jgi:hypothetical protein